MTIPYLYEFAIAGASVSHGHISSYPYFLAEEHLKAC